MPVDLKHLLCQKQPQIKRMPELMRAGKNPGGAPFECGSCIECTFMVRATAGRVTGFSALAAFPARIGHASFAYTPGMPDLTPCGARR
jgi:hypothetical protein